MAKVDSQLSAYVHASFEKGKLVMARGNKDLMELTLAQPTVFVADGIPGQFEQSPRRGWIVRYVGEPVSHASCAKLCPPYVSRILWRNITSSHFPSRPHVVSTE